MKPIGILYASREGQTERIVRRLAHALEDRGFMVDQLNLHISYSPLATDTSRDYEYTNWEALDRFAANFANQVVEVESGGLHSVT